MQQATSVYLVRILEIIWNKTSPVLVCRLWRDSLVKVFVLVMKIGFDLAEQRRIEFKNKYWLID